MLIDLLESSKAIGLCPMGILGNCRFFSSEITFPKNSCRSTIRVANSLDLEQG